MKFKLIGDRFDGALLASNADAFTHSGSTYDDGYARGLSQQPPEQEEDDQYMLGYKHGWNAAIADRR